MLLLGPARETSMHHLGIVLKHKMPQKGKCSLTFVNWIDFHVKGGAILPILSCRVSIPTFCNWAILCSPAYLLPCRVTVRAAYCFLSIFFSFVNGTILCLDEAKDQQPFTSERTLWSRLPNLQIGHSKVTKTDWHWAAFVLLNTSGHWKSHRNAEGPTPTRNSLWVGLCAHAQPHGRCWESPWPTNLNF